MVNYMVNVFIWSFSIYGFLCFIQEFWLDMICNIISAFQYFTKLGKSLKNLLLKN